MIGTLVGIGLRSILRDRSALVLSFVLPLLFFSVFAWVFRGLDDRSLATTEVLVVGALGSAAGEGLTARLAATPGLALREAPPAEGGREAAADEAERARRAVARGEVPVAVFVPEGLRAGRLGAATNASGEGRDEALPALEIYVDRAHPLAMGLVEGSITAWAMSAASEELGGALGAGGLALEALPIESVDVLGAGGSRPSVAFFAAGLAVLFVMLSVSGRSALFIEERESGVLERLLCSEAGLGRLIVARFVVLVALGAMQGALLFGWAALAFGLELGGASRLAGLALVVVASAAAASAFAMLLSSLCRTRAQLHGVSIVSILIIAALGGNIFPAFLMPDGLRALSEWLFNAWAQEAYQELFWYGGGVYEVLFDVARLALFAGIILVVTRGLVGRAFSREAEGG